MRLPAHFQVSIGDAVTYTLSGDSKEELHNQSGKESRAGQVLPCISGMAWVALPIFERGSFLGMVAHKSPACATKTPP